MPNFKNVEYFDQNQILFVNYRYGEWLSKRNLTVSKILEYGIIDFLIDYKGDKKEIISILKDGGVVFNVTSADLKELKADEKVAITDVFFDEMSKSVKDIQTFKQFKNLDCSLYANDRMFAVIADAYYKFLVRQDFDKCVKTEYFHILEDIRKDKIAQFSKQYRKCETKIAKKNEGKQNRVKEWKFVKICR